METGKADYQYKSNDNDRNSIKSNRKKVKEIGKKNIEVQEQ